MAQPTPGLHLAMDPRIPDELERFELKLRALPEGTRVEWFVDDVEVGTSDHKNGATLWPLTRGRHLARARVWLTATARPIETPSVRFKVK